MMGVDGILRCQPYAEIGIAGGYNGTCPWDVDTLDKDLQQKIRAIFPTAAVRIGNPAKLGAILVRWDGEGPCPSGSTWARAFQPGASMRLGMPSLNTQRSSSLLAPAAKPLSRRTVTHVERIIAWRTVASSSPLSRNGQRSISPKSINWR
jgi:hypothetical protein